MCAAVEFLNYTWIARRSPSRRARLLSRARAANPAVRGAAFLWHRPLAKAPWTARRPPPRRRRTTMRFLRKWRPVISPVAPPLAQPAPRTTTKLFRHSSHRLRGRRLQSSYRRRWRWPSRRWKRCRWCCRRRSRHGHCHHHSCQWARVKAATRRRRWAPWPPRPPHHRLGRNLLWSRGMLLHLGTRGRHRHPAHLLPGRSGGSCIHRCRLRSDLRRHVQLSQRQGQRAQRRQRRPFARRRSFRAPPRPHGPRATPIGTSDSASCSTRRRAQPITERRLERATARRR